jgi:hypothetical protein
MAVKVPRPLRDRRARATTVEVSRGGDLGFTQGTYSATFDLANGTQATERGKWVSQPTRCSRRRASGAGLKSYERAPAATERER